LKIHKGITTLEGDKPAIVTVGTFDGLHLGHQKIIKRLVELGENENAETVVVTFDPHPRLVIDQNSSGLKFISTTEWKYRLLAKFRIDHLMIVEFTKEFAGTSSEDFINNYLVGKLKVKKLVVGYDHQFGRNREGNYEQLLKAGKKSGFEVEEIEAQYVDEQAVSSTKIRNILKEGDVAQANKMLGYPYRLTGKVVKGNNIGSKIGFPTANLDVADRFKLIETGGVYACKVELGNQIFSGMGNIGIRPTLGHHEQVTEVHLFGFDKNIYGETITVCFIDRIREERKFSGLEELKAQLENDREVISKLLSITEEPSCI
jgi:riboflavin kinase/FMN adenylyltransferase